MNLFRMALGWTAGSGLGTSILHLLIDGSARVAAWTTIAFALVMVGAAIYEYGRSHGGTAK